MDQDDQGASATAAETICVCRDGHTGDPDDLSRGCTLDGAAAAAAGNKVRLKGSQRGGRIDGHFLFPEKCCCPILEAGKCRPGQCRLGQCRLGQ